MQQHLLLHDLTSWWPATDHDCHVGNCFALENQEIATGVGVKWKGQCLLLTAGTPGFRIETTLKFLRDNEVRLDLTAQVDSIPRFPA